MRDTKRFRKTGLREAGGMEYDTDSNIKMKMSRDLVSILTWI